MMNKLRPGFRILITNNTLDERKGSELYVRDISLALLKRGFNPIAYSSVLGDIAIELRQATIPVIDTLDALTVPPDLIHGQHHLDAMTAMLHFPKVPALFFCHGWLPWEELPPAFPSIFRYIAVDDLCKERLLTTPGIPVEKVRTLYNFVDLSKFKSRGPLPDKPNSALIFSNYATESNFTGAIRAACHRFGIQRVDVIGSGSGSSVAHPEKVLPEYDIVFAKARCALEAMAVGCAVIVADFPGLGGMVTTENMQTLRKLNFGVRTMQAAPISEDNIYAQLLLYNANNAKKVSEWLRSEAGIEKTIDTLETYYSEVMLESEMQNSYSTPSSTLAASKYLRLLAPIIKTRYLAEQRASMADSLNKRLQDLEQSIAVKDRQIIKLNDDAFKYSESAKSLVSTIEEQERLIAKLNDETFLCREKAKSLVNTIEEQEKLTTKLNDETFRCREKGTLLTNTVERQEELITKLTDEAFQIGERAKSLANKIEDQEKLINHIYNTYSWKITKPFRLFNILNRNNK